MDAVVTTAVAGGRIALASAACARVSHRSSRACPQNQTRSIGFPTLASRVHRSVADSNQTSRQPRSRARASSNAV